MKQRSLAICLIWFALATCAACSSAKDRGAHWVSLVQRAHQSADEYRKLASGPSGDDERRDDEIARRVAASAGRALRQAITEAPEEPDVRERWVIQDLYYRLAQLLTDTGLVERAASEVERGLAIDSAPTLARANLFALQGKLLEKQGEREAAAKAYHAALLVNEVLMDQALNGSTEQGSAP